MNQDNPSDEDRLNARLADLATRRRQAEETPLSDLEAYVRGSLDDASRARVEEAAAISPTIAGELKALQQPDVALRAAALRGWEAGWAREAQEEASASFIQRLLQWLKAPKGIAITLVAALLAVAILPRIFESQAPQGVGVALPSSPTLSALTRFQDGQAATFTIEAGEVLAPTLLFDITAEGIAWTRSVTPTEGESWSLEYPLIADAQPHVLVSLIIKGDVDSAQLSDVLEAFDFESLQGGEEDAALRLTLEAAGFDILSLDCSQPFVTVPL